MAAADPDNSLLSTKETVLEDHSPLVASFQLPPVLADQRAETVLVAEDEPHVRSLIGLILRSKGYTVLEAGSGADALAACDAHDGPVHLLCTDVIMPRMGGPELARRLSERRPGLRVLYLSGAVDEARQRHGLNGPVAHFLQKPFTTEEMGTAVREALGQS